MQHSVSVRIAKTSTTFTGEGVILNCYVHPVVSPYSLCQYCPWRTEVQIFCVVILWMWST